MVRKTKGVHVWVNVIVIDVCVNLPTFCAVQNFMLATPLKTNNFIYFINLDCYIYITLLIIVYGFGPLDRFLSNGVESYRLTTRIEHFGQHNIYCKKSCQ